MSSRKEYEMLFKLNAQLGSSYNGTFKSGQAQLAAMQNQLQALNKARATSVHIRNSKPPSPR